MSDNSTKLLAATLAAAVLGKLDISDGAEATKEVIRTYRLILRRLERLEDMDANTIKQSE